MKYELIDTYGGLWDWLKFADFTHLVWDTETLNLRRGSPLLGISFYDGERTPIFVKAENQFWNGITIEEFRTCFESVGLKSANGIGHNMKYDVGVFRYYKLPHPKLYFDTLVAKHLLNSDQRKQLEICADVDLDYKKKTLEEVVGKKWEKINWLEEGMDEKLAHYSCEDCFVEYKLYELYKEELKKWKLEKIFTNIELPLIDVLSDMYERGVLIDKKVLSDIGVKVKSGMVSLESEIYEKAGCRFNINSSKQLGEVLYDRMHYPVLKKTPKGGRSTDSDTMEKLAQEGYPIAVLLNEYSTLDYLNSNYIESIPKILYPDGRIRADFNSNGAVTGRFSCSHPNLQNQTNDKDYPIRSAYVPAKGYGFISSDYSQIELRVMAHASKDKLLVKTFLEGGDIHAEVANTLNISRKSAKIINFGIMYGMSPKSLARFLGIKQVEAKLIIDNYNFIYSGYSYWGKRVEERTEIDKYVRTIFGRMRHYPDGSFGSINAVIQGSAADLIKIAMVRLQKEFKEKKDDCHILLQIHDELLLECRLSTSKEPYYIERMAEKVNHIMSHAVELIVPTPCDVKIVDNWFQAKQDDFISIDRRKLCSPAIYML